MDEKPKSEERNFKSGLIWPDAGFPAYYCVLCELSPSGTETFDPAKPQIKIVKEGSFPTLHGLLEEFLIINKKFITDIYAPTDDRYRNYILEFNIWRRQAAPFARIRQTSAVSFEASILKIRDLITDKRINFGFGSGIRNQLAVFSKANIRDEAQFYAIRAFSNVIWAYVKPRRPVVAEPDPKLRAWW